MASASVVNHLHLDAVPLVDLRLLSKSEVFSLSLCSSSSYSSNDNDDVLIPKIDRSVFNESAGSRKQTYSRLRLAPRKPQSASGPAAARNPTGFPSSARQIPEPLDEENHQIISLLKELFAGQSPGSEAPAAETPGFGNDEDNLVSVRVEFEHALPDWSSAGAQNVPIDVVAGASGGGGVGGGEQKRKRGRPRKWRFELTAERKAEPNVPIKVVSGEGEKKRRRGRPRKNENWTIESRQPEREMVVAEEKETLMVNKKGDVAYVDALANAEDPYGVELKRRTEGLQTEAELLGFLSGLPGESVNKSGKKRIVPASDLGDALPEGWKLMLTIKKRASRVWLHCRRYISPNGHQFVSCKEVSSYLLSFSGLQDASKPRSCHLDENFLLARKMDPGDDAALKLEDGKNADALVSSSSLPMISMLTDYAKQDNLKMVDPGGETGEIFKCHNCTVMFDEKNDLAHHLISAHNYAANTLIIRDGRYECQLCHKIFDEKQQYIGHFGVHVGNYVKSVDTSGEVISNEKFMNPALTGVLPSTSKIQESIGNDRQRTIKGDKDDLALAEEHSDKQDKVCNMNNLGNIDIATAVVDRNNAHSVNGTDSVYESRSLCESSYERNIHECICSGVNSNVTESLTESRLLAPPGNDRTFTVENNVIKVSFLSDAMPKPETDSGSGLFPLKHDDKTFSEGIEGYKFGNNESTSAFRSHDRGVQDVCTNANQQCSSEGCSLFPFNNEQRSTSENNRSGIWSSSMLETLQEGGSGSGLCSSSTGEKKCAVRGNLGFAFTSRLDEPTVDKVNISGNSAITVGFGSNHASKNYKAVTSSKQEGSSGSCLFISSCNEQCVLGNNAKKNPSWTLDIPFQGKTTESHMSGSSVSKQSSGFDNHTNEVSTGAEERFKLDEVSNHKNKELYIAFDWNGSVDDADTIVCRPQEKCLLLGSSADEPRYDVRDYKICNSTMEELKKARGASEKDFLNLSGHEQNHDGVNNLNKVSCSSIEEADLKKVKSLWNGEVFLAFDTQERTGEDVTCTTRGQSSERFENKLDRVYMNRGRGWHRSEGMEKPTNHEMMINFGNHDQSNADSMAESMWRNTQQNIQQSGLANTSSTRMQSSQFFPDFDVISNKDGDKSFSANERFTRESVMEGLRSVRTGSMEHSFLTSQGSSHADKSKVLSYDVEMKGLDSSYWLQKETLPLLPKLASRHQVRTLCVWCRNEFYLESVDSELQSGSAGFMCATCNAKYSGQFL